MLNIIHIHVNDTSDEVTVECDYMKAESNIEEYFEFKPDVAGQILRYKILVRDMKIFAMLYNAGNGDV